MTLKTLITGGFFFILLVVSNTAAQQTPTALVGRIESPYGGSVRGATITITLISKKAGFTQTTTSDDKGAYLFPSIPPGTYRVFATDSNGSTFENPSFEIPADRTTRLDFKIEFGGDCVNSGGALLSLSEKEKAAIFNEILRDVLLKKQIAEYEQLARQKAGIVLADENILAAWLKPSKNIRVNLLSGAEMTKKAETEGAFMYLSFGEFKIMGNCVVVPISNLWIADTKSRQTPVTGGGRIFVYGKKGSKLKLKTSGSWKF